MLVLSRGLNDKVVFPTLGITVEILRLMGNKVRVGIDAPREIPILRQEIAERKDAVQRQPPPDGEYGHAVRNRLQKAMLGMRLLERMLETGQVSDAEKTIFTVLNELKSLEMEFAPPADAPHPAVISGAGRRALVVEDDPYERDLLANYLTYSGFDVSTAMDGLQAMVRLAQPERPDVVLLDMKMPRFDGNKTISAIRDNPEYRALRIFAVTGTDPTADVRIGPLGVNRWFVKPVDPEHLVQAIKEEFSTELVLA